MTANVEAARERYRLACLCMSFHSILVSFGMLDDDAAGTLVRSALDDATNATDSVPDCRVLAADRRRRQEAQAEADVAALFERVMR